MIEIMIAKLAGLGLLFSLGYIFATRNWLNEEGVNGLSWLVIDVTMPALFFCGVLDSGFSFENKGLIVAMAGGFLVSCLGMLAAMPLFRVFPLKNKEKGAVWFDCCVGNSSFLPLPIAMALWGQEGVLVCLAYLLGNNVFLFTVGIRMLRGGGSFEKRDFIRIFTHPQALAFFLGLLMYSLGLRLPPWVYEPLDALGKATLPLAMIATGAILAQATGSWQGRGTLLASVAVVKLVVLPLLVLICLKPFKNGAFGGVGASLVLLQAAMPSLASAGVYARRFGGDAGLAASGSLVTTLLSPLTLPLWMLIWDLI